MANLILCFELPVNFAIFWVKNRLYTFKIRWYECSDHSIIINKIHWHYSNSIYEIYLKPFHHYCFSLTYFQNTMKNHNDLARRRRLFTLKRFQCCRSQNTFQLACFPSLHVVNLLITFAVCKFVWTSQLWRLELQ